MLYNDLREATLEFFSHRQWVRPPAAAVALGFYPVDGVYSYLLRLHRFKYLARGKDYRGRIVYRLSPRGAHWLLERRRGYRSQKEIAWREEYERRRLVESPA
jgi:hypothetical protein